jgi:hypothetical protein
MTTGPDDVDVTCWTFWWSYEVDVDAMASLLCMRFSDDDDDDLDQLVVEVNADVRSCVDTVEMYLMESNPTWIMIVVNIRIVVQPRLAVVEFGNTKPCLDLDEDDDEDGVVVLVLVVLLVAILVSPAHVSSSKLSLIETNAVFSRALSLGRWPAKHGTGYNTCSTVPSSSTFVHAVLHNTVQREDSSGFRYCTVLYCTRQHFDQYCNSKRRHIIVRAPAGHCF